MAGPTGLSPRRQLYVALGVLAVLLSSALLGGWHTYVSEGPNIVLIVSDDQSIDSLPHFPPVMPYLQSRMLDPEDHWVSFTQAFDSNPLCCPSRATLLTGQFSHHTGVTRNEFGKYLDDSSTVATWLHGVGYYTGFFGKYINRYPFNLAPYVPPGWDEWAAKDHGGVGSAYYNYELAEGRGQGSAQLVSYGDDESDYMPDVLARKVVDFIASAPGGRPFFAVYAPTAPHSPWVPAPRNAGAFSDLEIEMRPNVNEADVSDKPKWVQDRRLLSAEELRQLQDEQRLEFDALLGVDDAVRSISEALEQRGAADDTVIIYLTDNGYSYGSHRWVAKRCAYSECNQTAMLIRSPDVSAREEDFLVSNVDVASTIAGFAGVQPDIPVDGVDLGPVLYQGALPDRTGLLLEWPGDTNIPAYFGLRTDDYLYVELATAEVELYDLTGQLGEADPYQLRNVAEDGRYADVRRALAAQLTVLTD